MLKDIFEIIDTVAYAIGLLTIIAMLVSVIIIPLNAMMSKNEKKKKLTRKIETKQEVGDISPIEEHINRADDFKFESITTSKCKYPKGTLRAQAWEENRIKLYGHI